MSRAIVVTPVKDSPDTSERTIQAICNSEEDFDYYVFNDFSNNETKQMLQKSADKFGFHLINLEDITTAPPPNYRLVLEISQKKAVENQAPLIIIESDVIVKSDTIINLLHLNETLDKPGLTGAITTDSEGRYNFPYNFEKIKSSEVKKTRHSLSFCCTILSYSFLQATDFRNLPAKKDWYDITISRLSKKLGFNNYLAKNLEVLHAPHSSRPWKNLKYTNLPLYYIQKILRKRDRI